MQVFLLDSCRSDCAFRKCMRLACAVCFSARAELLNRSKRVERAREERGVTACGTSVVLMRFPPLED